MIIQFHFMSDRLLMIKLNHNNVKVVPDPRAEDATKNISFQSFSLFKNKKQQDPFQSNSSAFCSTGLPFAQTNAINMLGVPSSHLKSSTFPSPVTGTRSPKTTAKLI